MLFFYVARQQDRTNVVIWEMKLYEKNVTSVVSIQQYSIITPTEQNSTTIRTGRDTLKTLTQLLDAWHTHTHTELLSTVQEV